MFHTPCYGYQNAPNYPYGMVPNPYLQGHYPMQNQYYQPPMQQPYTPNINPPPHQWNDPMLNSQIKNPYMNNNKKDDKNIPNMYNNTSSMKASFGGGWSKRAK